MPLSTDPADAVVYLTAAVASAAGGTTYVQGSGVLVAPDEVLTAAHLAYDASGHLYADIEVSAGYEGAPLHAVVAEAGVHAAPFADYSQVSGTAVDFALIHLAASVTDVPAMALGSDFAGGAVTVSGYPTSTAGRRADLAETLSAAPGFSGVLRGTPLGLPGDPHGASGGPAWQAVGGVATVVGLTSSEVGSTGYFVDLTAADVAQIRAWEAADHPAVAADAAVAAPAADAVSALSEAAAGIPALAAGGALGAAMDRLVALLGHDAAALGAGAGFDAVAAEASAQLAGAGGRGALATALLDGVLWGRGGGAVDGAFAAVAGADPGLSSLHFGRQAAHAGAVAGRALLAAEH